MANNSLSSSSKRHYRHPGCRIPFCKYRHKARGYCNKHYQRVMAQGDPFVLGRRWNHTAEERFWDKVDKTPGYGPGGDCWLWTGCCVESGHGRIRVGGDLILTHRYSFKLTHGHYPEPCGLHHCDIPSCVNPAHIYAGTKQDNANDKVIRGRCQGPVGSAVRLAKLTEIDIPTIRQLLISGLSQAAIAQRYGVSQVAIGQIALGRTWKHVKT